MAVILYNVTVKVETSIAPSWLQWMQEVHVPDVMQTGCFTSYRICQLLGHDDDQGVTFAIQYECPGRLHLERYQHEFASSLQKEHAERFPDKFVAFRSLLEVKSEGSSN